MPYAEARARARRQRLALLARRRGASRPAPLAAVGGVIAAVRLAYGTHDDQRAELTLPEGDGPFPVVALRARRLLARPLPAPS